MATVTYNGTNFDTHLGSATITASTAGLTLAGITSAGVTAPNTSNKITGVWICISVLPSNGGNITAEIMESGVSKATATINNADAKLGMNYFRYATPYQFTTTGASAYTCRLKNTVGSSGNVRTAASGLWFAFTYDTAAALGASDDVWVGGFNDAGLTTKTWTVTGTANTWGSKATTAIGSTTQTMGAALTIGSGGTFKHDTAANCTTTLKGSVWVTAGGVFDIRGSATKSIVSTFIIDSTANGDQGIFSATGTTGGQILTTGATYTQAAKYASGTGTAADPLTYQSAHGLSVGDEIVVPGLAYNTNQVRFVITVVNTTQVVVSTTSGGGESAITNTPAVGSHIANLTRNTIIKPLTTNLGYYISNSSNTAGNFDYTRFEYADNNSGKSITLVGGANGAAASSFDGIVGYQSSNGSGGRHWLAYPAQGTQASSTVTHSNITAYNTGGSNYGGQSGFCMQAVSNKTIRSFLHYNGSSTTTCGTISLYGSSVNNTLVDCHSYGANAGNSAGGYAFGCLSVSNNTINDCSVNNCRQNAVLLSIVADTTFNNCNFGNIGTNTVDIFTNTGALNTNILFEDCNFYSATFLSNYRNQLDGSRIAFQNLNGDTSSHSWHDNKGSWWSSGTGLTDTTVRTAGSLALACKPEDATTGTNWVFKIPAIPNTQCGVFGYLYRNAAFSSGTLKVELFLPGTLLTDTPDYTQTMATTTGRWLPFNVFATYSGSVTRFAQVRITGVTATAGAYFFLDDLYDATTLNKVAGLDLWDRGQPSPVMLITDFNSAIPVITSGVWSASDSGTVAGTMGKHQADLKLTNVLVKDGLS